MKASADEDLESTENEPFVIVKSLAYTLKEYESNQGNSGTSGKWSDPISFAYQTPKLLFCGTQNGKIHVYDSMGEFYIKSLGGKRVLVGQWRTDATSSKNTAGRNNVLGQKNRTDSKYEEYHCHDANVSQIDVDKIKGEYLISVGDDGRAIIHSIFADTSAGVLNDSPNSHHSMLLNLRFSRALKCVCLSPWFELGASSSSSYSVKVPRSSGTTLVKTISSSSLGSSSSLPYTNSPDHSRVASSGSSSSKNGPNYSSPISSNFNPSKYKKCFIVGGMEGKLVAVWCNIASDNSGSAASKLLKFAKGSNSASKLKYIATSQQIIFDTHKHLSPNNYADSYHGDMETNAPQTDQDYESPIWATKWHGRFLIWATELSLWICDMSEVRESTPNQPAHTSVKQNTTTQFARNNSKIKDYPGRSRQSSESDTRSNHAKESHSDNLGNISNASWNPFMPTESSTSHEQYNNNLPPYVQRVFKRDSNSPRTDLFKPSIHISDASGLVGASSPLDDQQTVIRTFVTWADKLYINEISLHSDNGSSMILPGFEKQKVTFVNNSLGVVSLGRASVWCGIASIGHDSNDLTTESDVQMSYLNSKNKKNAVEDFEDWDEMSFDALDDSDISQAKIGLLRYTDRMIQAEPFTEKKEVSTLKFDKLMSIPEGHGDTELFIVAENELVDRIADIKSTELDDFGSNSWQFDPQTSQLLTKLPNQNIKLEKSDKYRAYQYSLTSSSYIMGQKEEFLLVVCPDDVGLVRLRNGDDHIDWLMKEPHPAYDLALSYFVDHDITYPFLRGYRSGFSGSYPSNNSNNSKCVLGQRQPQRHKLYNISKQYLDHVAEQANAPTDSSDTNSAIDESISTEKALHIEQSLLRLAKFLPLVLGCISAESSDEPIGYQWPDWILLFARHQAIDLAITQLPMDGDLFGAGAVFSRKNPANNQSSSRDLESVQDTELQNQTNSLPTHQNSKKNLFSNVESIQSTNYHIDSGRQWYQWSLEQLALLSLFGDDDRVYKAQGRDQASIQRTLYQTLRNWSTEFYEPQVLIDLILHRLGQLESRIKRKVRSSTVNNAGAQSVQAPKQILGSYMFHSLSYLYNLVHDSKKSKSNFHVQAWLNELECLIMGDVYRQLDSEYNGAGDDVHSARVEYPDFSVQVTKFMDKYCSMRSADAITSSQDSSSFIDSGYFLSNFVHAYVQAIAQKQAEFNASSYINQADFENVANIQRLLSMSFKYASENIDSDSDKNSSLNAYSPGNLSPLPTEQYFRDLLSKQIYSDTKEPIRFPLHNYQASMDNGPGSNSNIGSKNCPDLYLTRFSNLIGLHLFPTKQQSNDLSCQNPNPKQQIFIQSLYHCINLTLEAFIDAGNTNPEIQSTSWQAVAAWLLVSHNHLPNSGDIIITSAHNNSVTCTDYDDNVQSHYLKKVSLKLLTNLLKNQLLPVDLGGKQIDDTDNQEFYSEQQSVDEYDSWWLILLVGLVAEYEANNLERLLNQVLFASSRSLAKEVATLERTRITLTESQVLWILEPVVVKAQQIIHEKPNALRQNSTKCLDWWLVARQYVNCLASQGNVVQGLKLLVDWWWNWMVSTMTDMSAGGADDKHLFPYLTPKNSHNTQIHPKILHFMQQWSTNEQQVKQLFDWWMQWELERGEDSTTAASITFTNNNHVYQRRQAIVEMVLDELTSDFGGRMSDDCDVAQDYKSRLSHSPRLLSHILLCLLSLQSSSLPVSDQQQPQNQTSLMKPSENPHSITNTLRLHKLYQQLTQQSQFSLDLMTECCKCLDGARWELVKRLVNRLSMGVGAIGDGDAEG